MERQAFSLTQIFLLVMGLVIVALALLGEDFAGHPLPAWKRAVGTGGGMFFVYLGLLPWLRKRGPNRPRPGKFRS